MRTALGPDIGIDDWLLTRDERRVIATQHAQSHFMAHPVIDAYLVPVGSGELFLLSEDGELVGGMTPELISMFGAHA